MRRHRSAVRAQFLRLRLYRRPSGSCVHHVRDDLDAIEQTPGRVMSSREDILAAIRLNRPQLERPLPAVPLFDAAPPASLLAAFKDSLQLMGGLFLDPPSSSDLLAPVREKIAGAKVVCSTVPEIGGTPNIPDA